MVSFLGLDFTLLKHSAPAKAQHQSSSRSFLPWGGIEVMGGVEKGTPQCEPPAAWHPHGVPAFTFGLSLLDYVVFLCQSRSRLSGYGCLGQHPWKLWAVVRRAAWCMVSLQAAMHGQGNRKQAEKREDTQELCEMWRVRAACFGCCALCRLPGIM